METRREEKRENRRNGAGKTPGLRGYAALLILMELACLAKLYDGVTYTPAADPAGFIILLACIAAVTAGGLVCVTRIEERYRETAAYGNALFVITAVLTFFAILYGGDGRAWIAGALMAVSFAALLLLERHNAKAEALAEKAAEALAKAGQAGLLFFAVLLMLLL